MIGIWITWALILAGAVYLIYCWWAFHHRADAPRVDYRDDQAHFNLQLYTHAEYFSPAKTAKHTVNGRNDQPT
ncbi:hypothetical protein [Deefgea salmonis]|uniref:Uncharacterized protein n=1 Tax=Deefgea salmonis TaxID=2875502 RepID=A0ABS8BJI3_9NEIS|nr:hypothetical protein [Deefgea salmonis]MCB5195681.1 hypothetical protein [Deefgea salmonis]